jgi:hypothetical protein
LGSEYQNPKRSQQANLQLIEIGRAAVSVQTDTHEWPKQLSEQAKIIHQLTHEYDHPILPSSLNVGFKKVAKSTATKCEQQIVNILKTFCTLGLLRKTAENLFLR